MPGSGESPVGAQQVRETQRPRTRPTATRAPASGSAAVKPTVDAAAQEAAARQDLGEAREELAEITQQTERNKLPLHDAIVDWKRGMVLGEYKGVDKQEALSPEQFREHVLDRLPPREELATPEGQRQAREVVDDLLVNDDLPRSVLALDNPTQLEQLLDKLPIEPADKEAALETARALAENREAYPDGVAFDVVFGRTENGIDMPIVVGRGLSPDTALPVHELPAYYYEATGMSHELAQAEADRVNAEQRALAEAAGADAPPPIPPAPEPEPEDEAAAARRRREGHDQSAPIEPAPEPEPEPEPIEPAPEEPMQAREPARPEAAPIPFQQEEQPQEQPGRVRAAPTTGPDGERPQPEVPIPEYTRVKMNLVSAKDKIGHQHRRNGKNGKVKVEEVQDQEVMEREARLLARERRAESREQRKEGKWISRYARRMWGTIHDLTHYVKEKNQAFLLLAESGLKFRGFSYDFQKLLHDAADKDTKGQHGKVRKFFQAMFIRRTAVDKREVELMQGLRQAAGMNPDQLAANQQLNELFGASGTHRDLLTAFRREVLGDFRAGAGLASRIGDEIAGDAIRGAIGERKASDIRFEGPAGQAVERFFKQEVITPMLQAGLGAGISDELRITTQNKIKQFLGSKTFLDWRSSLPPEIQDRLELSLSYGTDLMNMVEGPMLDQARLIQGHVEGTARVEQYIDGIVLEANIGTLKSGEATDLKERWMERRLARRISNKKVLEMYSAVQRSTTEIPFAPDEFNMAVDHANRFLGVVTAGGRLGPGSVFVAGVASMGLYAGQRAIGWGSHFIAPILGGSAAGAAVRAWQERQRFTREVEQHRIESSRGVGFDDDARRRKKMDKLLLPTIDIQDTIDGLELARTQMREGNLFTDANLQAALGVIADMTARRNLADIEGFELYKTKDGVYLDAERTKTELLRSQLLTDMRKHFATDAGRAQFAKLFGSFALSGSNLDQQFTSLLAMHRDQRITNLRTGNPMDARIAAGLGLTDVAKAASIDAREHAMIVARRKAMATQGALFFGAGTVFGFGAQFVTEGFANDILPAFRGRPDVQSSGGEHGFSFQEFLKQNQAPEGTEWVQDQEHPGSFDLIFKDARLDTIGANNPSQPLIHDLHLTSDGSWAYDVNGSDVTPEQLADYVKTPDIAEAVGTIQEYVATHPAPEGMQWVEDPTNPGQYDLIATGNPDAPYIDNLSIDGEGNLYYNPDGSILKNPDLFENYVAQVAVPEAAAAPGPELGPSLDVFWNNATIRLPDGTQGTFEINGSSVNLDGPNGNVLIENIRVDESGGITWDAPATPEGIAAQAAFEQSYQEFAAAAAQETTHNVLGPDGLWAEHSTDVKHWGWYNEKIVGVSDHQELQLDNYRAGDHAVRWDITRMHGTATNTGGYPPPLDVDNAIQNNDVYMAYWQRGDPGNPILVQMDHGQLTLDQNSHAMVNVYINGELQQMDQSEIAKMVFSSDLGDFQSNSDYHGYNDLFNTRASAVVIQHNADGTINVNSLATSMGSGHVPDTVTTGGIQLPPLHEPPPLPTEAPPVESQPSSFDMPPIVLPPLGPYRVPLEKGKVGGEQTESPNSTPPMPRQASRPRPQDLVQAREGERFDIRQPRIIPLAEGTALEGRPVQSIQIAPDAVTINYGEGDPQRIPFRTQDPEFPIIHQIQDVFHAQTGGWYATTLGSDHVIRTYNLGGMKNWAPALYDTAPIPTQQNVAAAQSAQPTDPQAGTQPSMQPGTQVQPAPESLESSQPVPSPEDESPRIGPDALRQHRGNAQIVRLGEPMPSPELWTAYGRRVVVNYIQQEDGSILTQYVDNMRDELGRGPSRREETMRRAGISLADMARLAHAEAILGRELKWGEIVKFSNIAERQGAEHALTTFLTGLNPTLFTPQQIKALDPNTILIKDKAYRAQQRAVLAHMHRQQQMGLQPQPEQQQQQQELGTPPAEELQATITVREQLTEPVREQVDGQSDWVAYYEEVGENRYKPVYGEGTDLARELGHEPTDRDRQLLGAHFSVEHVRLINAAEAAMGQPLAEGVIGHLLHDVTTYNAMYAINQFDDRFLKPRNRNLTKKQYQDVLDAETIPPYDEVRWQPEAPSWAARSTVARANSIPMREVESQRGFINAAPLENPGSQLGTGSFIINSHGNPYVVQEVHPDRVVVLPPNRHGSPQTISQTEFAQWSLLNNAQDEPIGLENYLRYRGFGERGIDFIRRFMADAEQAGIPRSVASQFFLGTFFEVEKLDIHNGETLPTESTAVDAYINNIYRQFEQNYPDHIAAGKEVSQKYFEGMEDLHHGPPAPWENYTPMTGRRYVSKGHIIFDPSGIPFVLTDVGRGSFRYRSFYTDSRSKDPRNKEASTILPEDQYEWSTLEDDHKRPVGIETYLRLRSNLTEDQIQEVTKTLGTFLQTANDARASQLFLWTFLRLRQMDRLGMRRPTEDDQIDRFISRTIFQEMTEYADSKTREANQRIMPKMRQLYLQLAQDIPGTQNPRHGFNADALVKNSRDVGWTSDYARVSVRAALADLVARRPKHVRQATSTATSRTQTPVATATPAEPSATTEPGSERPTRLRDLPRELLTFMQQDFPRSRRFVPRRYRIEPTPTPAEPAPQPEPAVESASSAQTTRAEEE